MRKNILIINKEIIYPPHRNGISNTLFNLIQEWICLGYKITIIYLNDIEENNENILRKFGINVINKNILGKELFVKIGGEILLKPKYSWDLDSKKFFFDVAEYEYTIIGSLTSSIIIDRLRNLNKTKVIFFEADALAMFYNRGRILTDSFLKKIHYFFQEKAIKKLEKRIYSKVDKIFFVSEVDKNYVMKYYNSSKIKTIKLGVPFYEKKKVFDSNKKIFNIGFSGIMDYEPNVLAVEYIINELMPLLDMEVKDYKIHIIGKNPKNEWYETNMYKNGKLIITGFLEDINSYISMLDIYISPLFLGSGMKNKILQAMSLGVPIVASLISIEGINELQHNKNFLLCDEKPKSWVISIKKLLNNSLLRKEFANINQKIIKENYSWKIAAKKILEEESDKG